MTMRIDTEDVKYLQDVLGRCLDDFTFRPDIGFGQNELATEIRNALDILSQYSEEYDPEVQPLDFS